MKLDLSKGARRFKSNDYDATTKKKLEKLVEMSGAAEALLPNIKSKRLDYLTFNP